MSTEIHYNFNKEAGMGTDPFDDLWNVTHKVPESNNKYVEDYDEVEEDDYSEQEDLI